MDAFMNKIVEKLNAQDIIKANSQAETAEAQRIKQEAEQYKAQLEEMRQNAREYKDQLDEIQQLSREYKEYLSNLTVDGGKTEEVLKETTDALSKRIDDNDTRIHDVGVQIYRNVQAVVEKTQEKAQEKNQEEFKAINAKLETLQVALESVNGATLPLIIITLLVSLADLIFNVLKFLKLI